MRLELLDESRGEINDLVNELLATYGKPDIPTLIRIAKEKFGVEECIEVPFTTRSAIVREETCPPKYYIIYSGFSNTSKKINLTDEVCHVARSKLHFCKCCSYQPPWFERLGKDYLDAETVYFASQLLGISEWRMDLYRRVLQKLRDLGDSYLLRGVARKKPWIKYKDCDKSEVLTLVDQRKKK